MITIFGEVLFDHFPDGSRVLGGAPFNVAWHLQAFGQYPQFISRIGNDVEGQRITDAMHAWGMNLTFLQQDSSYPTGKVQVTLHKNEPTYAILANQAYDQIDAINLSQLNNSGILYHGTLVTRTLQSKDTLRALKAAHQGKIFIDVNLRVPWWHKEDVLDLIKDTNWVKLNFEEFHALAKASSDMTADIKSFLTDYNLEVLIVTYGEKGAIAYTLKNDTYSVSPTCTANVSDTVGAGDAFSAVLLLGLNLNWSLADTMTRAQAFASAMIEQRGATVNDRNFYQNFIKAWSL